MKLSYLDSYDIRAPAEPGRAKTVIVLSSCPSSEPVIQLTLPPRARMAGVKPADTQDPYRWLEDVTGEKALDWVRARLEPTKAEFCDDEFERMRAEALEVLDTDARIP